MFHEYISKDAHIQVPDNPVPVTIEVNGEKVKIGEGYIDLESGVFTTILDPEKEEYVRPLLDQGEHHYSLGIQVAEVKAVQIPDFKDQPKLF